LNWVSNNNLTQLNNGGLETNLKKLNGLQVNQNQTTRRHVVKLAANNRNLMSTQYLQKLKPLKYRDSNRRTNRNSIVTEAKQ
jgi:hypothetical protein